MTTPPNPRDGLSDDAIDASYRETMGKQLRPQDRYSVTKFVRLVEAKIRAADREARPAPASVEAVAWQVRTPGGEWRTVRDKLSDEYVADMGYEVRELGVIDRLAAANTPPAEAQPVATLHDDGCFTWKSDAFRLKYDRERVGWRMDVYATPPASEARATGDAAGFLTLDAAHRICEAHGASLELVKAVSQALRADAALSDRSTGAVPAGEVKRLMDAAQDAVNVFGLAAYRLGLDDKLPKRDNCPECYKAHDAIEALARLAATGAAGEPQPREGWKPIETAPTDGTHILAFFPLHPLDDDECMDSTRVIGGVRAVTFMSGSYWLSPDYLDATGAWFGDDCCYAEDPTHWMPLPEPPQADSGAAGGQGDSNA